MASILFPGIASLRRFSRGRAGENAIITGVIAARAYATRTRNFVQDLDPSTPATTELSNDGYSGVALLFTPANEIRLVENVEFAVDGNSNPLELKNPVQNGYDDIPDRDYIVLPSNMGVMGIRRGSTATTVLIPPPFAVRFDEDGRLISRASAGVADGSVYYDGDYNGKYEVTLDRSSSGYIPRNWDPEFTSGVPRNAVNQRWHLPFEKIETVIGVIAYDKAQFVTWDPTLDPQYDVPDSITSVNSLSNELVWLLGGDPGSNPMRKHRFANWMFFSRYSGTVMREDDVQ